MIQIIEGITAAQLIELYTDPYIKRVGHDHRPAAPVLHPLATYISAFVDGEFAGAFLSIKISELEIELHALLKKQFLQFSRDIGQAALAVVFKKSIQRITAPVIEGFDTAMNYCLKMGFKREGFKRDSFMVNGQLKGVYILGLTRQEWSKR